MACASLAEFYLREWNGGLRPRSGSEASMPAKYPGLPAAASLEQAIVLAQLLILRDLEKRAALIRKQEEKTGPELRAA